MLLPYQTEPAARLEQILRTHGAALDASDTGVGKTYVAIHAVKPLGLPVGIICPKSVIPVWRKVAEAEGVAPEFVLNYELLTRGRQDVLGKSGKEFLWGFRGIIIWDEVHRCRSWGSLNSRMLIAAWKTREIRCLMLSATAAQNPLEMRALGYCLGLHKNHDFWPWVMRLGAKRNRWGGFSYGGSEETLRTIHSQVFPERGVRVRIKDLGDAFPENQVIPQVLEVDFGQTLEAYKEAEEEMRRLKAQEKVDYPAAFTIQLRARQKIELLKIPVLVEHTKELLEEGKSVCIFVNFNATLSQLALALNTDCIIRDQSPDERRLNLERFQSDERRVIVCNLQAGGQSISLHDTHGNHPRVSLIAPTYNAVDLRQCLGRIHRSGGCSKSLQYLIYAAGTVEEKIAKAVEQKLNNLDLLNDAEISDSLSL